LLSFDSEEAVLSDSFGEDVAVEPTEVASGVVPAVDVAPDERDEWSPLELCESVVGAEGGELV
jgi:hypothetical protein